MDIGVPELLIVLVVVLLLFGPGRISKTAGELGKGIKAFRDGLSDKDNAKADAPTQDPDHPDEPKSAP